MQFPKVQYNPVRCEGGWDQITPSLSLKAGVVKGCLNFECSVVGGYSRIGGYERFSGLAKPSNATSQVLQVTSFTNTPSAGQTLTGFSSGATGVIAYVGADYMVLTKLSLAFTLGETVKVGATVIGVKAALTLTITNKMVAQFANYAADIYRADIAVVPGSGAVRGVEMFNDVLYAFRNNAGGTACDMYKSSAAGWVQVAFEYEIGFSNANTSVADGDVLTQGVVTATVRRVVVQTGTLASGVNTGRMIISAPAGGNFGAGAATSTGGGALTLSAIQTAITLLPGGKFVFDKANFFGQIGGMRLYGCDGVNRMWEFDGTYFVPLATGTTPDTPKHLVAFKNHLMCQIQSTNVSSAINDPYNWSTTAGASFKALGDTLTGYAIQPGSSTAGTMTIFGRNNVFMLYGTSSADWQYVTYAAGVGALDYTAQQMAQTFFLDDRGVTTLQASQVYGNFDQAALTNNIKTFINSKRTATAYSSVSRERSQYRLFFNDGSALYATIVNGKYLGGMQVKFPTPVYCACSAELASGEEALFVGATNGYVYQLDKGASFDGEAINASLRFNWDHAGSPRVLKRWRKGSIEMQGSAYAEILFKYSLAYGSVEEIQPAAAPYASNFSASAWDDGVTTWDGYFFWDGRTLSPTEVEMAGTSENVQIIISSSTDYIKPYTVNSIITHYTPRRGVR